MQFQSVTREAGRLRVVEQILIVLGFCLSGWLCACDSVEDLRTKCHRAAFSSVASPPSFPLMLPGPQLTQGLKACMRLAEAFEREEQHANAVQALRAVCWIDPPHPLAAEACAAAGDVLEKERPGSGHDYFGLACGLGQREACARVQGGAMCSEDKPATCLAEGGKAWAAGDMNVATDIWYRGCQWRNVFCCRRFAEFTTSGQARAVVRWAFHRPIDTEIVEPSVPSDPQWQALGCRLQLPTHCAALVPQLGGLRSASLRAVAAKVLLEDCNGGELASCLAAIQLEPFEKTKDHAVEYARNQALEHACDRHKHPGSCFLFGRDQIIKDTGHQPRADHILRVACEAGLVEACALKLEIECYGHGIESCQQLAAVQPGGDWAALAKLWKGTTFAPVERVPGVQVNREDGWVYGVDRRGSIIRTRYSGETGTEPAHVVRDQAVIRDRRSLYYVERSGAVMRRPPAPS